MGTKQKQNRAADEVAIGQAVNGIHQHITSPVQLLGQSMAPQAIVGTLLAAVQADTDLDTARNVATAKLAAQRAAMKLARAILRALKKYLESAYGQGSPILADFGMATPPKAAPTAQTKAIAVQKSHATRAARHTMGSRQKEGIKGTVPATPASPAAPSNGSTPKA